ncbi:LPXTG cell wall anchor domain-containing protein [Streptomyces armeniacus]|uniref:LPXTG cell wall anchor domain-containing protein n=2 Tax=Streptomyces armeniacus TaxID=83291 RepID=A0A345XMG1_9ACTN|nr:LPXTG cell wall anchor domain-containing protein [Streptomyces armeniacus]
MVGTGMFAAAPASAHTPQWSVDCSTVTVDLKNYSSDPTNTVTVQAEGKDLLNEKFGGDFSKKLKLADHDKPVEVRLIVKANDGDQHNRDETKTAPVCDESPEPTPTPTPTDTPSETPSPSESSTPPATGTPSSSAPASSEAAPAPSTSEPSTDLAETGSSSSTPLIAGIAAAVVLVGGALLMLARKRRSAQQ